ncbi:hypothetical protein PRIPAC_70607, partial [Pristionchus pacificus]|uniref:Membrane transporter n=1 Tax=Pristionchus pacificus TaxID=54126 RepID=A0A2A6CZC6_PRIPA
TSHGPSVSLSADEWSSQWSTIVSSFYPGSIVGFLLMPIMVSRLGTKLSMGILSFPSLLGCALQLLAALPSAGVVLLDIALCGGRFLVGIQAGAALCFLPLFLIEISNPASRSLLSTFQQVSQAVGTLLGLLFGSETLFPMGEYRIVWLQLIAAIPSVLLIVLLSVTPPTPHYLMHEGVEVTKVLDSLKYYQGTSADLLSLQNDYTSHAMKGQPRSRIPSASWKGFAIGSLAAVSYSFTADDLIDTFSSTILHGAQGEDPSTGYIPEIDHSADLMSLGLGVVLVLASLGGSFLVDRFGRRPLIILGLIFTALFNFIASFFLSSLPSVVLLFFALTKASIGLGAGAPAWFLTSELVALPYVPLFQSLSTGLLLCSSMIVTFFYLPLSLVSPPLSLLLLSSIPSLILAILLFLFLPETKDKSPRDIELKLASRTLSGFKSKVDEIGRNGFSNYGSLRDTEYLIQ